MGPLEDLFSFLNILSHLSHLRVCRILNFLLRIEFDVNFDGKLIFFKILSLEFTKNNLVTEFPISPKISISMFILSFLSISLNYFRKYSLV